MTDKANNVKAGFTDDEMGRLRASLFSEVEPALAERAMYVLAQSTLRLTDEQIITQGYMRKVEMDEPLFTFDRPSLLSFARSLVAPRQSGGGLTPETAAQIAGNCGCSTAAAQCHPAVECCGKEPCVLGAGEIAAINDVPVIASRATSAQDGVRWDMFPAWLIDHCEGETITEEGLQSALADMLKVHPVAKAASAQQVHAGAVAIHQWRYFGNATWLDASADEIEKRKASNLAEDMEFRTLYTHPAKQA